MKTDTDAIGEHYCLSELLLAEKEAYLANGSTQKGWDIVVLDGKKNIRVQVKGINWNSDGQATVKGMFISHEFEYLVIVLLNFNNKKFTSYVIPYDKLKEKGEKDKDALIDSNGFVYYSARTENKKGSGFNKQAISISTLKYSEKQKLFEKYESNFCSIKA